MLPVTDRMSLVSFGLSRADVAGAVAYYRVLFVAYWIGIWACGEYHGETFSCIAVCQKHFFDIPALICRHILLNSPTLV